MILTRKNVSVWTRKKGQREIIIAFASFVVDDESLIVRTLDPISLTTKVSFFVFHAADDPTGGDGIPHDHEWISTIPQIIHGRQWKKSGDSTSEPWDWVMTLMKDKCGESLEAAHH